MKEVKRGQLWYCDLGVGLSSEQSGDRPCVIVQNDKGNQFSPNTIICPITSKDKVFLPTHVIINSTKKQSVIMTDQIRTISKTRLIDCIGELSESEMAQLNKALIISLEINFW